MPGDNLKKTDLSAIDEMPVEALRRVLEDDLESPVSILDEEELLCVCEALTRKEKESGAAAPDAETAFEEFRREFLPFSNGDFELYNDEDEAEEKVTELPVKRRTVRKPFLRLLAAVIAAMLLGAITASAMDLDVWDGLLRWTRETFGFSGQTNDHAALQTVENAEYPTQLEKLRRNMAACGIDPTGLLPAYLPAGYYEIEMSCQDIGDYVHFICTLTDGENNIILQYWQYRVGGSSNEYQKDAGTPEKYEVGGIAHYVASNEGKWCCIWMNGDIECSVSCAASRDELIKIIDSVYGG